MTEPIGASALSSWFPVPDDATPAENAAQMNLPAAHELPDACLVGGGDTERRKATVSVATVADTPPSPPAVPQPHASLLQATWHCAPELANVALTSALIALAVPETTGASLLALGRIALAVVQFDRCAIRDEAQQEQMIAGQEANAAR